MSDFFSDQALASITEHVLPGLWPLLLAFAVCMIAVPLAIRLSRRYGVVAQPGGRHAHANPTPMLGGLAMWIGLAIAMAVFAPRNLQTLGLLVVSGLATGLLIIDDPATLDSVHERALELCRKFPIPYAFD